MTTDIFAQGKTFGASNFYFKEVGDQVQGTYIGKRTGEKDNFGNDVITYELKVPDGVANVSFTTTKKINEDMNHVRFGQIIGFKFVSRDKFMKNGKETEFKNIKIFADAKIVDQDWLNQHEGGKTNDSGSGKVVIPQAQAGFGAFDDPYETDPLTGQKLEKPIEVMEMGDETSPEGQLKQIADLARTKLGVVDPTTLKEKVMEATELAFIPTNYEKIIEALKDHF